MEIVHRIVSLNSPEFEEDLDKLGVKYEYEDSASTTVILLIPETNKIWPKVKELVDKHRVFDNPSVQYTDEEKKAALWFYIGATGHFGYPQPSGDFGYIEMTYDTSNYCSLCGIGGQQKAPFRFSGEPKSRHSHFIQLNWVFDEIFIRPEVRIVFDAEKVSGIAYEPAIIHKSEKTLASLQQLRILHNAPPGLLTAKLNKVTCKINNEESHVRPKHHQDDWKKVFCGRVKYHYPTKCLTEYRNGTFRGAPDILKSSEWFGSGGSASQLIIVSRRVADIVTERKWRGLYFVPITLV